MRAAREERGMRNEESEERKKAIISKQVVCEKDLAAIFYSIFIRLKIYYILYFL